jgi:hypothetical protein
MLQTSPSAESIGAVVTIADQLSLVAVLLLIIWALLTRRLVPTWVLDASEKREERYRSIAEQTLNTTARTVGTTEKAVSIVDRTIDKVAP